MNPSSPDQSWRILLLDTKRSNPNHYLCLAVKQALSMREDVALVICPVLGEAWQQAKTNQCNLFIAFDGEELHKGVCERLAALCGRSVLWVTEDPYERQVNAENGALFDLVFTNDSASVPLYAAKGRHLPLASSVDLHFAPVRDDEDCLYDLFFAGTAWPNRVHLIKQMLSRIENLKTKLVLPHNEHLPDPLKTLDIPPSTYSWRMSNSQFTQFSNRSRVVLSLHREFTSSPGGIAMAQTPGPRFFEVALAGGFQLVDMSLPEAGRYFEEGKEFVGFSSPGEAVAQLQHYLAHPSERIAIARAAQQRARSEHLYANRVDALLAEVARLQPQPSPVPPRKPLRRVLHVTHNLIGIKPFGGVEVYQDWIIRSLGATGDFQFFFLVPDSSSLSKKVRLYDEKYHLIEETTFSRAITQEVLTDAERESAFSRLLTAHSIDLVHVQHLIGHVPSLPYIARALGVPTVLSLHDYYTLCWQINLLDHTGRFCAPEHISETACDICIATQRDGLNYSQAARRSFYGRMLSHVDILHGNTDEVIRRFQAVYPALHRHSGIRVQGVPIPDGAPSPGQATDTPIRIALLGNFTLNKGAEFLMRVFDQMASDKVRFEVLGNIDPDIRAEVTRRQYPNVVFQGGYAPGEQAALLRGASIALFASKWPETYCLSLSEAWQAGLVPVAPDIGAFAERIEHGINGFKFEPDRLSEALDHLRLLIADGRLLSALRRNMGEHLYATTTSHTAWLQTLYTNLAQTGGTGLSARTEADSMELSLADSGVTLTQPVWLRTGPTTQKDAIQLARRPTLAPAQGLLPKALRYLRRHGVVNTARRVVHELKKRCFTGMR